MQKMQKMLELELLELLEFQFLEPHAFLCEYSWFCAVFGVPEPHVTAGIAKTAKKAGIGTAGIAKAAGIGEPLEPQEPLKMLESELLEQLEPQLKKSWKHPCLFSDVC